MATKGPQGKGCHTPRTEALDGPKNPGPHRCGVRGRPTCSRASPASCHRTQNEIGGVRPAWAKMVDAVLMNPAMAQRRVRMGLRALRRAEDPDRWTTGCAARDANGRSVMPERLEAVRFDGIGALFRLTPGESELRDRAVGVLETVAGLWGWTAWQDTPGRTHAEVLAAMDRAIASAETVAQLADGGKR